MELQLKPTIYHSYNICEFHIAPILTSFVDVEIVRSIILQTMTCHRDPIPV